MKGYVHSLESFGTVDGPGIRFVIFLQGCPMRCLYCHNPDTWELNKGTQMDTEELLSAFEKNRAFYKDGGITVTGGEPLVQIDFVTELFQKAKERGIHTCLDTSGIVFRQDNEPMLQKFDALAKVTDLVLLDIKHINPEEHKILTKQPNDQILAFSQYLDEKQVPVWIRHVVVPGITDNPAYLYQLGYYIGGLTNLKALDVLPYHSMGKVKYEKLGIDYPLQEVADLPKEAAIEAKKHILDGIRSRREQDKAKKV